VWVRAPPNNVNDAGDDEQAQQQQRNKYVTSIGPFGLPDVPAVATNYFQGLLPQVFVNVAAALVYLLIYNDFRHIEPREFL
jgi:hypothetical protein